MLLPMLTAEWLHIVLYLATEYYNSRKNIINLLSKYLVNIRSDDWLKLFWEYIIGKLFAAPGLVSLSYLEKELDLRLIGLTGLSCGDTRINIMSQQVYLRTAELSTHQSKGEYGFPFGFKTILCQKYELSVFVIFWIFGKSGNFTFFTDGPVSSHFFSNSYCCHTAMVYFFHLCFFRNIPTF
jgi:hypothetical protein